MVCVGGKVDQDKIGNFIKSIRKENNLTQKDLADRLGVTYQAVSKWENGKNIPDIAILKQISEEFNIDIHELLNGEKKQINHNKKYLLILIIIITIFLSIITITIISKNTDFEFKTISSNCSEFKITGSAAYNKDKTAIYISNIEFCGKEDKDEYIDLECTLYETNNNTEQKISTYTSKKNNITLEDFLKDLTLSVNNYKNTCKDYKENSLYLIINATKSNSDIKYYKIPLKLTSCEK